MNKVRVYIIEKRNFWYWIVMTIALMMFANTELLSMIIPIWETYLINAVLIIVTTVYSRFLIVDIKERSKEKKAEDEKKLYAFLEQSLKDMEAAICSIDENVINSTEFIKNELCSSKEVISKDIEAKKNDISEELALVKKHEVELHELLKKRIDNFEVANKDQLENSMSKVLNLVSTTENSMKENLSEITDLIDRNAESNKANIDASREVLHQEINSNGNKAEENTININKNIEEVRTMFIESVTTLLETIDASVQVIQKENIDNIASQTKELIEKLDNILEENKNSFDGNLEEIEESRSLIVEKLSLIDEANSTVFNHVNAKANEILSSSGDLDNKLNMVSEMLENFEQQTISAIVESSSTVSQEVKDGAIQSTIHMNDVSEKVIEIIQKNGNDTVEKLNHQKEEILFAIDGSEIKAQKNYDSIVDVLSEIKISLDEVETEISNAEKGNVELTEELKKSIEFELQNIGDELSKIEEIQSDNVVHIIELVDGKLLGLNQELIKQANSILDKSDENTDYVSEKYTRVFNQIQSVAKESKILINKVNDAIEENKNTIIQSKDSVSNLVGSYFQGIKSKENELKSLKAVVERNFLNISSELEITRGQLSSLNSLSVLIKNLSEKREDKVERKQNRIETIEDPDSGLTVKNEYRQDKLVTSQMFRGSKKVYDVVYDNRGKIVSTKNYNESGKVNLEMTYHSNGQVKERTEYIFGKAEISRFDANGNKIK